MPKTPVKADVTSFVGGLVTEASGLNFPPNASPDIVNFEHNKNGSIRRRLGFDYEPQFLLFDPPSAANNVTPPDPVVFKWTNAAGISDFSILVCQFDNALVFFDLDADVLSRNGKLGEVTLTDFPKDVRYGIASVDGRLVVVAGIELIAIVNYDDGLFTVSYDVLRTRDLWGIEGTDPEGILYEKDTKYRGNVHSNAHIYNLQNQSWGSPRSRDSDGASFSPISLYLSGIGRFPSNSEQVWVGMQYKPDAGGNPTERFYPNMARDLFGTNALAAKGYFIIDVINRGVSRREAVLENDIRNGGASYSYTVPNLPDYTDGGASCVAEFAGRIFYAGFSGETVGGDARSPNLTSYVFFSQLVKSSSDLMKCYQLGDPTSRDESDLLETDGGFIRISGAEKILGMAPIGSSLVVVCTNGVWAISGGSDYGFSATNYRVDKVSSFGCVSAGSIVEEKGRIFYWGEEGIFVVAKSQLADLEVDNITRGRIDTFYQDLPISSRITSYGIHDSFTGKVRWLYKNEGIAYELILDTTLQCFYPFRLSRPSTTIDVVAGFTTTPFVRVASEEEVFSGTDLVEALTSSVVVDSEERESALTSVKYLIKVGSQYTFGYYRNTDFIDFQLFDGIGSDAAAHCLTGTLIVNDGSIRKQLQYMTMYMKRTEEEGYTSLDSSCLSSTRWDWSGDAGSMKWSALKQLYRVTKPQPNDNFDIVVSRNLVRGQGRALALYFETEPLKDCHIIGWSLAVDGNSKT